MTSSDIIAILRGVAPDEVIATVECLVEEGFRQVEVPLNSPAPFESLERLKAHFGEELRLGAGTVMTCEDVDKLADIGIPLTLTPNSNADVVRACQTRGIQCFAGFATPSEAFTCIEAGTDSLKLFPASHYGCDYLSAIKAVIPEQVKIIAVGGVDDSNLADWMAAGADGVGIGSWLYHPTRSLSDMQSRARFLMAVCQQREVR